MSVVVHAAAVAAYWTAVAVLGANLVYGVALFVPFGALTAKIVSRRWPAGGIAWTPPLRGIRLSRDTTDDADPEIAMRLRIVNLVYLVAFGLLVVMLVVEIVRSATETSL